MRFRSFFSFLLAVVLGAVVAVAIKIGYALPSVLPTSDIFMFILESPLGKYALKTRGGEGGVLIAIAIRAFTCSILVGAIAGLVLQKIRYQRAFCYSVLWLPTADVTFGYLSVSAASASSPAQLLVIQKSFGQAVWTNLWVYGWYFLALYLSFVAANRITQHSTSLTSVAAR